MQNISMRGCDDSQNNETNFNKNNSERFQRQILNKEMNQEMIEYSSTLDYSKIAHYQLDGRRRVLSANKSDVGHSNTNKTNSLASTFYKTNTSCFTGPPTGRLPVKNLHNEQELGTIQQQKQYNEETHQPLPLWRQSSSTWRRSSASHQFPHQERFVMPKPPGTYVNTFEIGSTLRKRATSFGYGKKTDIFPPKHIERAQINPAPNEFQVKRFLEDQNQYKIKYPSQQISQNNKVTRKYRSNSVSMNGSQIGGMEPGKTFGMSFEYYCNNYLEHAKHIVHSPVFGRNKPGPDAYKVGERIGKNKQRNSIHKRLRMFNEQQDMQVPPHTKYVVSEKLVAQSRFKGLQFGQSERQTGLPLNNYPGPEYKILRDFDDPFNLCPSSPFR